MRVGSVYIDPLQLLQSLFLCDKCFKFLSRNHQIVLSAEDDQLEEPPASSSLPTPMIVHFKPQAAKEKEFKVSTPLSTISKKILAELGEKNLLQKLSGLLGDKDLRPYVISATLSSDAFFYVMKEVERKHKELFKEMSFLLQTLCGISQKKMQNIVRLSIFSKLKAILFFNPIASHVEISLVKEQKVNHLLGLLGFRIIVEDGKMAIVGDIGKIIEWYLRLPGTQGVYKYPNKKVHIVLYPDAHPFFQYTPGEKSQTSVQMRILSEHKVVDVLPVARWFGGDGYKDSARFAKHIYPQTKNLKIFNDVEVQRTMLADGAARRSSFFSLYP